MKVEDLTHINDILEQLEDYHFRHVKFEEKEDYLIMEIYLKDKDENKAFEVKKMKAHHYFREGLKIASTNGELEGLRKRIEQEYKVRISYTKDGVVKIFKPEHWERTEVTPKEKEYINELVSSNGNDIQNGL